MTAAVLAWFFFCMAYLVQALVRESAAYARMKQRFELWSHVRHDLRHATHDRRLEIEDFLAVIEDVLKERGYLSYVAAALDIEDRTLRAVRIIATLPADAAVEVIKRTAIARDQIECARNAVRR